MPQRTEEEKYLLGQMLPGIAAQLRGPMNNLAASMLRALPEGPDGRPTRDAAIMQQSYYRLLRLVDHLTQAPELLDDTPLPKENTEVCSFFGDICLRAEGLFAAKEVGLHFHCQEPPQVTALNRDYTARLMWNLLSNALKYSPPGGTVSVSVRFAAEQLLVTVADEGPGIPPDELGEVFDHWHYQQESTLSGRGFGLGLALSRHIAQRQGGRLLLGSRPRGGTAVTLALPRQLSAANRLSQNSFDYAGGFSRELLELSDALPYTAFLDPTEP